LKHDFWYLKLFIIDVLRTNVVDCFAWYWCISFDL